MALIHKKRGFTLVELLIVITIIGILAAALIPQITGAQASSRDASRQAIVEGLRTSLSQYNLDNGEFPVDPDGVAGGLCLSSNTGALAATNSIREYLPSGTAPVDPSNTGRNTCGAVQRSMGYKALAGPTGAANGAYILYADVETAKKSNLLATANTGTINTATALSGAQAIMIPTGTSTATADINTLYVVIGS